MTSGRRAAEIDQLLPVYVDLGDIAAKPHGAPGVVKQRGGTLPAVAYGGGDMVVVL